MAHWRSVDFIGFFLWITLLVRQFQMLIGANKINDLALTRSLCEIPLMLRAFWCDLRERPCALFAVRHRSRFLRIAVLIEAMP